MVYFRADDVVDVRDSQGRKQKRVPPSRLRYEASHPVVSFRISKEDRDMLADICRKSNKSLARVVKEALGKIKLEVDSAYKKGYEKGFGRIKLYCKDCEKPIIINTQKDDDTQRRIWDAYRDMRCKDCAFRKGIKPGSENL